MRLVPLLSAALLAGLAGLATNPAASAPSVRWVWGPPGALTANQDFAGPAVYTQTLSVTGVSGTVGWLHFGAFTGGGVSPGFPPAWWMLKAPTGLDCQGRPSLSASPFVTGTEPVPDLVATVQASAGLTDPIHGYVEVYAVIDPPFAFDPDKRYGIATLRFDHAASVAGAGDATHCGGADAPMCFLMLGGNAGTQELANDVPLLSWQGAEGCVGVVPVRRSSWGEVKLIYR